MAEARAEHYLLNIRNDEEKRRLDIQSETIRKLRSGHLLEFHVPKENIRTVADIATGTGIWLSEVATELEQAGNSDVRFVGFDISDAQFPKDAKINMQFEVADIHQGFAEKWHGSFDVVHLRLLLVVLTIDQIEPAVRNVVKLLKPGGYLQWDDLSLNQKDPGDIFPSISEEVRTIWSTFESQGWSRDLFANIRQALQSCPVEEVRTKDYLPDNYNRPELQPSLTEWARTTLTPIIRLSVLRKGSSEEDANAEAGKLEKKIYEAGKRGTVMPVPLLTLTAMRCQ